MKDTDAIYLPSVTMADIGNLMMVVGKNVFDEIIQKLLEMSDNFKNLTYDEYKKVCKAMKQPIQDEKGYQALAIFLSGFVKGIAYQMELSEEEISDNVAKSAILELQKLYTDSIDEEKLAKAIMQNKNPVKV